MTEGNEANEVEADAIHCNWLQLAATAATGLTGSDWC
jgi:hypothetical protein